MDTLKVPLNNFDFYQDYKGSTYYCCGVESEIVDRYIKTNGYGVVTSLCHECNIHQQYMTEYKLFA